MFKISLSKISWISYTSFRKNKPAQFSKSIYPVVSKISNFTRFLIETLFMMAGGKSGEERHQNIYT